MSTKPSTSLSEIKSFVPYGRRGVHTSKRIRSGRVACSGLGRDVLDFIDTQERRQGRQEHTLTLPISPNNCALLQLPIPLDREEWNNMMHLLGTMKPGIVGDD